MANEGLRRCVRYMNGWLEYADPDTGLIPSRVHDGRFRHIWDPHNAAADNYPFMVLTAWFTDRDLFDGRMLEMLRTEEKLTSRIGAMPDTYDFERKQFAQDEPDMASIQFKASEYVKDGLLPLTEWLGPSPWSKRNSTATRRYAAAASSYWPIFAKHAPTFNCAFAARSSAVSSTIPASLSRCIF